jgi:hypothetical protein
MTGSVTAATVVAMTIPGTAQPEPRKYGTKRASRGHSGRFTGAVWSGLVMRWFPFAPAPP